jgi:hypothetical protein
VDHVDQRFERHGSSLLRGSFGHWCGDRCQVPDSLPVGKHTLEVHTAGTYLGELVDFSNTTIITVT